MEAVLAGAGVLITALSAAVAVLWSKRAEVRREDRKDTQDEWRGLVDKLRTTLEETERRNKESAEALVRKLEAREAECRKIEIELARMQERLSHYEKGEPRP